MRYNFRFFVLYVLLLSVLFGYTINTEISQKVVSMGDPIIYKINLFSDKQIFFEQFDAEHNRSIILEKPKIFFEYQSDTNIWYYSSVFVLAYFELGDFDLPKVSINGYIDEITVQKNISEIIEPKKIKVQGFEIEDYQKVRPLRVLEEFRFNFFLLITFLVVLIVTLLLVWFIISFFRKKNDSIENTDVDLRFAIKNIITQLKNRWNKEEIKIEKVLDELDFHFREFLKYEYKYLSVEKITDAFVINFIYDASFYFSKDLKNKIKEFFKLGEYYRFSPSLLIREPEKLEYFFKEVQNLLDLIEIERNLQKKGEIGKKDGI